MSKFSTLACALFFVFTAIVGCKQEAKTDDSMSKTETPAFDLATAKKEIGDINKGFMEALIKGDSVTLANYYTTDAMFMNTDAPSVKGRANIQTEMSRIINSGISKVDIMTDDIYGTEELLAEEGNLKIFVKDAVVGEEKYIVLWKKEDGQWKLFRDIFNSNLARTPAPTK
ncbi:MAG: DUF4440 domain-containing protein [Saprospiraceae bacterium]